jgi:HEAT repeat protein
MKYLAAHGDPTSIVQKLLEWSRLPMHRPLLAAARWLRDARHDAVWCSRLYSALAALLQADDVPLSLRAQALAAFIVSNDSGSAALFRKFANTFSFELVQLAALGCGAVKDMKAIPILEKMLEAPSISARRAACIALVAIGSNEALEIVAHVLLNADEDLRRAAAEALANHPGEGHAMLKDGVTLKDILLRRAVMYGLARVDEPWAIELLQQAQVQDDQWVVRNAAAESLESRSNLAQRAPRKLKAPSQSPWLIEFAGKQGLGISPGRPATDLLLQALKDEDPDIRLAALPYLKQTPTEGVIGQLYNAMYKDDPELREAAYHILWEIGASGVKLAHPSQYGFS